MAEQQNATGAESATIADTQDSTPASMAQSTETDKRLKEIRHTFAPFFFWVIAATFVLIAASVIAVFAIIFFYAGSDPAKALMAQTVHASLGMILGLVAISFGVVINWVAIEAPFTVRMHHQDTKSGLFLQSVSSGIVLMLGGMILVGMALYMPMHYKVTEDGATNELNRAPLIARERE